MNLFDRVVELRIGDTNITGLDIAFDIEKDETPEPNPCHIDVFNLGPENRATLSKYKIVPVVLKAGYKGGVGVIFQGDMVRCSHIHENASWRTTISCGDGAQSIQSKRIKKTYAKGTPVKTVVEDLARQLDLPANSPVGHLEQLKQELSRGFMVSGNPMAEMARLLSSKNMLTSIQNGALQIRKISQPLQKEAISLNSDSGLIASPEIGHQNKMMVRAVLMPELQPGRQAHINSATFKGFVVIEKIRFTGSNFGDDWESELECKTS